MAVFLAVLKIIAIVLAAVIGLVVALFLIVLFVPVRYNLSGSFHGEAAVKVKAIWLAHAARFNLSYENDELSVSLKVAWFELLNRKDGEKSAGGDEKSSGDEKPSGEDERKCAEKDGGKLSGKDERKRAKEDGEKSSGKDGADDAKKRESESERKAGEEKSGFERFLKKLSEAFSSLSERAEGILEKLSAALKKAGDAIDFITDETTVTAVKCFKTAFFTLIGHILPKKFTADVRFGFKSPDATGKTLAALAVICGMLGKRAEGLKVTPDFEERVFDGDILARGRIRLNHFAAFAVKLLSEKEVIKTYKRFKKEFMS